MLMKSNRDPATWYAAAVTVVPLVLRAAKCKVEGLGASQSLHLPKMGPDFQPSNFSTAYLHWFQWKTHLNLTFTRQLESWGGAINQDELTA